MSSPFATPDAVKSLAWDVKGVAPKDVLPEALILRAASKAGVVEGDAPAVRVPYLSLDAGAFVPEGTTIEDTLPDDSEVVIHTGKIASLVPLSREQYGQDDVASLLSEAMKRDLLRKANAAFLAQAAPEAPAVTPPAGLIYQSPTTLSTDPIEVVGSLDPLADAIATVEAAGAALADLVIVASPVAWATIVKLKAATDSNTSLLGAGVDAVERRLLSVPVLVDRDAPAASLLLIDRHAVLAAYGEVSIATSADARFADDVVLVRGLWRFGAKIVDANRVVLVDVLDVS